MFWNFLGVGGNIPRKFSSVVASEQRVLKPGAEAEGGNQILEDEIAKIRHAFNTVKERFLNIPDALQEMPKTDPEGSEFFLFFVSCS